MPWWLTVSAAQQIMLAEPRRSESLSQRSRIILLYACFAAALGLGVLLSFSPGLFVSRHPEVTAAQAPLPRDEHEFSESVYVVETLDDWNSLLKSGRYVLFVDCDWNPAMVVFRRPFSSFADWCREETDYRSVSVKMIAYSNDKLSTATQELMRTNEICQGGLRTYGGAGRVIWLEGGRVLDYEWCHEFLDEPSKLKARSRNAFR